MPTRTLARFWRFYVHLYETVIIFQIVNTTTTGELRKHKHDEHDNNKQQITTLLATMKGIFFWKTITFKFFFFCSKPVLCRLLPSEKRLWNGELERYRACQIISAGAVSPPWDSTLSPSTNQIDQSAAGKEQAAEFVCGVQLVNSIFQDKIILALRARRDT